MPKPKKRFPTKRKRVSVKVKPHAKVVRKDRADVSSIKSAPAKVYPENGAHFKLKVRKK